MDFNTSPVSVLMESKLDRIFSHVIFISFRIGSFTSLISLDFLFPHFCITTPISLPKSSPKTCLSLIDLHPNLSPFPVETRFNFLIHLGSHIHANIPHYCSTTNPSSLHTPLFNSFQDTNTSPDTWCLGPGHCIPLSPAKLCNSACLSFWNPGKRFGNAALR